MAKRSDFIKSLKQAVQTSNKAATAEHSVDLFYGRSSKQTEVPPESPCPQISEDEEEQVAFSKLCDALQGTALPKRFLTRSAITEKKKKSVTQASSSSSLIPNIVTKHAVAARSAVPPTSAVPARSAIPRKSTSPARRAVPPKSTVPARSAVHSSITVGSRALSKVQVSQSPVPAIQLGDGSGDTVNEPAASCITTNTPGIRTSNSNSAQIATDKDIEPSKVSVSEIDQISNLTPGREASNLLKTAKRNLFELEVRTPESDLDGFQNLDFSDDLQSYFDSFPSGLNEIEIPLEPVVTHLSTDAVELSMLPDVIFMEPVIEKDTPSRLITDAADEAQCVVCPGLESECDQNHNIARPSHSRAYFPPEKLTRKRLLRPERWKKNIMKQKISKGEEYVNSKGKVIRAKTVQPPCDLSCRMKCSTKLTSEDRQEIFDLYYKKHPTREDKWGFISRHVTQRPKEANSGGQSRRKNSRRYSFRVGGVDSFVCKTMFLATLDINDKIIETVATKTNDTGSISPCKMGKHQTAPRKIDPNIKSSIREHIQAIPRMPRHYTRADSSKEYLTSEIQSQKLMHDLYLEWMKEHHPNQKIASYRQYCDVFSFEFNISFFVSKKDLCDDCVKYSNAMPQEQEALTTEYEEHVRNKDLAQAMYDADRVVSRMKTADKLVVAAFDYEKALICPKANASVFYYRRKLTVNNFTLVDEGRHEDYCFLYDESIAGKGPNEVGSFVLIFIQKKVEAGVKEFRFYSDNCFGQNKNRVVAAVFLYAAAKYKITIRHRFLEKGHTYNAADSVHSLIERKTKPYQMYSPKQWFEAIEKAKRSQTNPIQVIKVNQQMIMNWKDLAGKLNTDVDVDGRAIPWQKLREISYDGEKPYEIKFKENLDDLLPITVNVRKVGRPVNLMDYSPKIAYDGPRPISQKKYEDLIFYCDNNFIPPEHQDFFRRLKQANDNDEEALEDEGPPTIGRARKMKPKAPPTKRKQKKVKKTQHGEADADELGTPPPKKSKTSKGSQKKLSSEKNKSKRARLRDAESEDVDDPLNL